jgi:hypothetical protein
MQLRVLRPDWVGMQQAPGSKHPGKALASKVHRPARQRPPLPAVNEVDVWMAEDLPATPPSRASDDGSALCWKPAWA